jgi:hypothetical protein
MNFLEAMKLAREGKQIRRPTWAKTNYIYLQNDRVINESCHYITLGVDAMLQEDWEIYVKETEIELHSFQEAFTAFNKRGVQIKRFSTEVAFYKTSSGDNTFFKMYTSGIPDLKTHQQEAFNYDDIMANDWIIEE